MIDSPYLKRLLREKSKEFRREFILDTLAMRFKVLPEELARELRAVKSLRRLRELIRLSVSCKSLRGFRKHLAEGKASADRSRRAAGKPG